MAQILRILSLKYNHFQKMRLYENDIKEVIVDILQIRMHKLYLSLHFVK